MDLLSQSSTSSTIPPDIIDGQDEDFIDEIDRVNNLYFGNVASIDDESTLQQPQSSNDTNCDDSDEENNVGTESVVETELRETDLSEQTLQSNFQNKTCGCVRLYGKPCSSKVDWNSLIDYRNHCLETSHSELDLIIKVQLFHHRRRVGEMTESKKHPSKEREKPRQEYFFNGLQVCRVTFAFADGVNRKKIDSIAHSLDSDGLVPRTHGNTGKSPKHALTLQDVENIKQFLICYGNKYGLPLPGRLPNHRDSKVVLLPSDKTKADIHQDYLNAAGDTYRKVCLSEFKTIWLEQCPYTLIVKPASDLCHKCQSFVRGISNSGNLTEEEKVEKLTEYKDHLDKAKSQRDQYRDQCEEAKTVFTSLDEEKRSRGTCSCIMHQLFVTTAPPPPPPHTHTPMGKGGG